MHALALALLLHLAPVNAGTLADVTLPDTATVAGTSLILNGLGLREKYFIDVYVGGLYVPEKMSSGDAVINLDAPKKIVMHFIYKSVSAEKMRETWQEGFEPNPVYPSVKADADTWLSWMEDVKKGDDVVLEYVPNKGTTLYVRGQAKGTIVGADFMHLVFGNYMGSFANKQLREGLLGN